MDYLEKLFRRAVRCVGDARDNLRDMERSLSNMGDMAADGNASAAEIEALDAACSDAQTARIALEKIEEHLDTLFMSLQSVGEAEE